MSERYRTQINLWLEKMEDDAAMNSRRAHLSFYATVVILVAAPLVYMMGWL